ncbi:type I-E CRISPR-associated protein Cas7/Cse4/CasC [Corynebacterium terpenotabidum]|uniref:CRISPR-associated Cse4 family protein n=1 Tax=Corynebacterium terpenotabidum Y-11 TaxID=1200352 RepID=S4XMT2_9CORY|nr:type I-E CRISPR-associated protein Cas7/Cse4/CasC [Corynebacterium terpenotabidum]AGP31978.1 CRISPR-associated Cse4 family protein [Corynebacterium terpenotabidum Y-11]
MTTYLDLHILQLVPPSCINRDDTGSPKSARFGGVERHRVSSQAWKRAARREFAGLLDAEQLGERTKYGALRVAEKLRELRPDLSAEESLESAGEVLKAAGITMDKKNTDQTSYLVFLSRQEIERFAQLASGLVDGGEKLSKKDARAALAGTTAVDIALFGRMLADAPELNVDAACQVEHALSVHKATTEFDYFTAVDDNAPEDNAGAGMIGTVEFVSSTLYRYATVNIDKLTENLGDRTAAVQAVEAFVRAFSLSMPTGKQNTFANRTRPDFVLAEVRTDQPVSLVNAFESPVNNDGSALASAAVKLAKYAVDGDRDFGTEPETSLYLVNDRAASSELASALDGRSTAASFPDLISAVGEAVRTSAGQ